MLLHNFPEMMKLSPMKIKAVSTDIITHDKITEINQYRVLELRICYTFLSCDT